MNDNFENYFLFNIKDFFTQNFLSKIRFSYSKANPRLTNKSKHFLIEIFK